MLSFSSPLAARRILLLALHKTERLTEGFVLRALFLINKRLLVVISDNGALHANEFSGRHNLLHLHRELFRDDFLILIFFEILSLWRILLLTRPLLLRVLKRRRS